MSEKVELEQLSPAESGDAAPGMPDLHRLSDVPIDLTVEIGRTRLTVGETLDLRPGSILTLNRMAGEPVDLLVNGTPIARGEVVVIDEQFGVRITDVLGRAGDDDRGASGSGAAPSPPAPAAD
jgi:flagellar motor switch protein FliN/FliY